MTIGILVLAAGRATRFGADKRLALLPDGRCVIDATIANVLDSGLPFLVCLGESDDELGHRMDELNIPWLRCGRAGEGMGGTLAESIGLMPDDWERVLIALADMPWIEPATFSAIAEQTTKENIVVPVHGGRRGHPVGFGRAFYAELAALGGDAGAQALLGVHASRVMDLRVDDAAIQQDIDVPADLL